MSFQQSISWWCFENRGLTANELMAATAAMGYTGVELLPPQQFQLAKEHNLQIGSV